jgi:hypothetical protein
MREAHGGPAAVAAVVISLLGLIALAWLSMLVLASVMIGGQSTASRVIQFPPRASSARAAG